MISMGPHGAPSPCPGHPWSSLVASCVTAPAFQVCEANQKAISEVQINKGFTTTAKPKMMAMN